MLQPRLGKQQQAGLNEAKRQGQEERHREASFDEHAPSRIIE
jgi:hypothetical protein